MGRIEQSASSSQAHPCRPTSKAPAQRGKVLDLLRERGPRGITNIELNRLCSMRFGARIFELRRMGYQIETQRESETIFRFVLRVEPQQPRSPHPDWFVEQTGKRRPRATDEAASDLPLFAAVQP